MKNSHAIPPAGLSKACAMYTYLKDHGSPIQVTFSSNNTFNNTDASSTLRTRPEVDLLLCCARTYIDQDRAKRIKILVREEVDWSYLTQTALRHFVVPLLYSSLSLNCSESIPPKVLGNLRNYFYANAQRNLCLTQELLCLLSVFNEDEISAVPYKGPILAASVYGSLAYRMFLDLDVWVRKRDIMRARRLLLLRGYEQQIHIHEESAEHAYKFVRGDQLILELHWDITPRYHPFTLDFERLWYHLVPVSLAGKTVLSLPPEDLLLILCVHGTRHRWERLSWVCDITELIHAHQSMDWERLMRQASTLGCERMLFLGLLAAANLLDATIPEGVLKRIQAEPIVVSLALQMRQWLFRENSGSPTDFESPLFHLRMRERFRDRIPLFLFRSRALITPNAQDRAFIPLPNSLSFLYYLVRLIRLIITYGYKFYKTPH